MNQTFHHAPSNNEIISAFFNLPTCCPASKSEVLKKTSRNKNELFTEIAILFKKTVIQIWSTIPDNDGWRFICPQRIYTTPVS